MPLPFYRPVGGDALQLGRSVGKSVTDQGGLSSYGLSLRSSKECDQLYRRVSG